MVGVRELRARLSAYLRTVSRGTSITIGNRRRQAVARLVPVARSRESELLDRLAEGGTVRRGIGKPGQSPRVKPRKTRRLLSDIVTEDRQ
ncbi:MAG: type II toxin-antitoxin system Phd/YefM family antitoxin [Candidatus Rokuibacteriota bacterium]